jgi:PPM family protein phosphatase
VSVLKRLGKRRGNERAEAGESGDETAAEKAFDETLPEAEAPKEPAEAEANVSADSAPAKAERSGLEETRAGVPRPDESGLEATAVIRTAPTVPVDPRRRPWLQSAQRCHVGRVRKRNEDSTYVFEAVSGGQSPLPEFGLYVVADGMGGHHAGHEASRTGSRMVARAVLDKLYLPMLQGKEPRGSHGPSAPIGDVMQGAVQAANQGIHTDEPDQDSGTTLTAALVFGRRLYVVHVGDSRAYLSTEDGLKQLTTDHSYVRRLLEAGQLTAEEAASHPQRNMLYKAVGQGGELEIDTFTQALPEKGRLLLCSDGLWGLVPNEVIQSLLQKSNDLQQMADTLVNLALDAGGYDNISAVIVDFYSPAEAG